MFTSRVIATLLLGAGMLAGCASNSGGGGGGGGGAPTEAGMKTEYFDRDPRWDGVQNRIKLPPVMKQQDFGWSNTHHAGGEASGEIGGVVWRSVTPAYFGKKVGPFSFDDELSASGTIAIRQAKTEFGWQTGSTVFFGFFNHGEQGWRPINFMGVELLAHTDTQEIAIESRPSVGFGLGSSKWTAGADAVSGSGAIQPDSDDQDDSRVPTDGTVFRWSFHYDPTAGDGVGHVTFKFGGRTRVLAIPRWLRAQGATFDRFGIFNNQVAGSFMELYFDDITINGQKHDFSSDPKWEGKGNRALVKDTREYGTQDYGYSSRTNHAGGKAPGEMGGFFQSVDKWEKEFMGYYGDRVGPLTLDQKLIARGKFSCENEYSIDSTFALGWFSSKDQGWPLKNFVGVFFDSLSDVGRIVQPLYGTRDGDNSRGGAQLTFLPDGTNYDWTLEYDPEAAGGRGAITFTMNNQTWTHALPKGIREKGARFDRFGVFNLGWANSKHCVVWFDDITYTSSAP